MEEVRDAFLKWKVVFFRGQNLDHAQHVAMAHHFGEPTIGHAVFGHVEGYPEVYSVAKNRTANENREQMMVTPWSGWHTDVTAAVNPPFASILRGVTIPPYGGDTFWTNLVAAYQGLSPTMRGFVDTLRAVHANVARANPKPGQQYNESIKRRPLASEHPLVSVHAETGERVLFASPSYIKSIVGLTPREGQKLLELIWEHVTRPEYTVRFKWNAGDIAFWDNRATSHLAPTDIFQSDWDRQLYRITLAQVDQEAINRVREAILAPDASPATVRRGVITPIRAVMLYVHRRGWCDRPMFEIPKSPAGRTNFLVPEEARKSVSAAAPHLKPLLVFLIGTGARMSEALELEWRDVDLNGARAIFWRTKNGARRVASLPPAVMTALRSLALRRDAVTFDAAKVFTTQRGLPYADRGRLEGGQIKSAWRGAIRRAGLNPDLNPHDLRHIWASWHYAVNRDLLALKVEGGGSSVALVERYAHLMPGGQEAEIRAFWHGGGTGNEALSLRG